MSKGKGLMEPLHNVKDVKKVKFRMMELISNKVDDVITRLRASCPKGGRREGSVIDVGNTIEPFSLSKSEVPFLIAE